jgi:hypothetical protein
MLKAHDHLFQNIFDGILFLRIGSTAVALYDIVSRRKNIFI